MFQWESFEEKRLQQQYFQVELLKRDAVAAVVISEVEAKIGHDGPIDISEPSCSVKDMPGRKDRILVEAGSFFRRVVMFHIFRKLKSGRFAFDDPKEFSATTAEMTSQFLDAIWPVRANGGQSGH